MEKNVDVMFVWQSTTAIPRREIDGYLYTGIGQTDSHCIHPLSVYPDSYVNTLYFLINLWIVCQSSNQQTKRDSILSVSICLRIVTLQKLFRRNQRDWSLITRRRGASTWENCVSKTFCAPSPPQDRVKLCAPPPPLKGGNLLRPPPPHDETPPPPLPPSAWLKPFLPPPPFCVQGKTSLALLPFCSPPPPYRSK